MNLDIQLDRLVLESDAERAQLEGAEESITKAFQLLGERLKRSPFERWADIKPQLIEALTLGPLSPDDWLGERGANRLADLLYQRLLERGDHE